MRCKALHIVLLMLLVASCGPRTIPRDDMTLIMADILVQEQQIKQNRDLRRQADTSLVYEGIFRKYGYDSDDFIHSLTYYVEDPTRMEMVMSNAAELLEGATKEVDRELEWLRWRDKMLGIYGKQADTTWPRPRVRPADTLRVRFSGDSVWLYYPPDTLKIPFQP